MAEIYLYDTTLRDGMQGEGMSLSAEEKVRVVHALDELGIHLIEAGFPASNPKEQPLFELLARRAFEHAEVAAFGMTRRRDMRRRATTRRCALLADCFAPVCTLVGKTWDLHLEKVLARRSRREPADDRRLGRLPRGARQARDLRRRALLRRLRATTRRTRCDCLRAAAEAGAETVALCDTNGGTLPGEVARGDGRGRGRAGRQRPASASTPTTTASCGVANSLAAVRAGARHGPGHDQRLRRALRQRQPDLDHPQPALKLGLRLPRAEQLAQLTEAAHLRLRAAATCTPDPNQPFVGSNAFAHKGGHARRRRQRATRAATSTSTRRWSATAASC